jgi:hypothetical protein
MNNKMERRINIAANENQNSGLLLHELLFSNDLQQQTFCSEAEEYVTCPSFLTSCT